MGDFYLNYVKIKKLIELFELSTDHFTVINNSEYKSKRYKESEYFHSNSLISRSTIKRKIYKDNLLEIKCAECNQGEVWNGKKMALILDHINGINNDHRLENLRLLCPNCNATQPTYCNGKNKKHRLENRNLYCSCGNIKHKKSDNCKPCNNKIRFITNIKDRPKYSVLKNLLITQSYVSVGKTFGVSDNGIRKWLKMYEKYNILD